MWRCLTCRDERAATQDKPRSHPAWAQGLYYNEGLFREELLYYDDEALFFEVRGQHSDVVRFSFERLKTLKEVVAEQEHADSTE